MGNGRQDVISVARVISAAFVALVIVGPAPYGYLMWIFRAYVWIGSFPLVILYCALCGLVAGIFAGKSLAAKAAILCVVWGSHSLLLELLANFREGPVDGSWFHQLLITVIGLGFLGACTVVSGLGAGWASNKLGIERLGRQSSVWIAIGLSGISLLVYAYAWGLESAVRMLTPEASRTVMKSHKPDIGARITGIYPTVTVEPCAGEPGEFSFGFASYTYYTDPTGHIPLGRLRVLDD